MKPRIRVSPHAAFTLVELLAVIAIIGILAAIIIPIVGRVRENARTSQCASNLRGISNALHLYAADNKNQLPAVAPVWPPPTNEQGTWLYKTWIYAGYSEDVLIKDPTTFRAMTVERSHSFACPSTVLSKLDTPTYNGAAVNGNVYSYGLNCLSDTTDAAGNVSWKKGFRLNDVVNPARTFMVAETSFPLGTSSGYLSYFGLLPHRGSANFAFFDGHVENRSKAAIPDTSTSANRRFWNGQ